MYPTISGIMSRTVERGTASVDLKKGVSATDYKGTTLKVKVSGKCNTKKTGKYKITYTATDSSGKTTTKSITITVKDTKKPTAKVAKKTLTYQKAVSEKQLLKDLKANITAKDSGETLASKYITISAKKLTSAMANKKAGTYTVTAYATDKAGNKSKKVSFTVKYMGVAPVVSAANEELTYKEAVSEAQLQKELKANVTATENGKAMAAKYITVNADELIEAMENETYGTYTVTAYAKNSMGKKSKTITFTVQFTEPETQPDDGTELSEEESTESTESTESAL
jgi:hypothetical protein